MRHALLTDQCAHTTLRAAPQAAHALLSAKMAEIEVLLAAGAPEAAAAAAAAAAPLASDGGGDAAVVAAISRLDALAGALGGVVDGAPEASCAAGAAEEENAADAAAAIATLRAQLAQTHNTLLRVRASRAVATAAAAAVEAEQRASAAAVAAPAAVPPAASRWRRRRRGRRQLPRWRWHADVTGRASRAAAAVGALLAAACAPSALALVHALAAMLAGALMCSVCA